MQTSTRLALFAAAALLPAVASAELARGLIRETDAIAGGTVTSIQSAAGNGVGGYAFNVITDSAVGRIWGSPTGAAGAVLRSEGTFGALVQNSYEAAFGMSDAGAICYSASGTGGTVGGFDSIWVDDTPVIVEGDPATVEGDFWRYGSQPRMTASGVPCWVSGLTATAGGSTAKTGLFSGLDASPVLVGGDTVANLPNPLVISTSAYFGHAWSPSANHYITPVSMSGVSTSNDAVIVLDGAGLMFGSVLVQENFEVPESVGGLPFENWTSFGSFAIRDTGEYLFSANTTAADTTDEILVGPTGVLYREGQTIDGLSVTGPVTRVALNNQGDQGFLWGVSVAGTPREALIVNGQVLIQETDEVDFDGDGAVDAGKTLVDIADSLWLAPRGPTGSVKAFFIGSVDVLGTPGVTADDLTTGFEITLAAGLTGDANCDGAVNNFDIDAFVAAIVSPAQFAIDYPGCDIGNCDIDGDNAVNNFDIDPFVALIVGP